MLHNNNFAHVCYHQVAGRAWSTQKDAYFGVVKIWKL